LHIGATRRVLGVKALEFLATGGADLDQLSPFASALVRAPRAWRARDVAGLRFGQFWTEDLRDRLASLHVLTQFGRDPRDPAANGRCHDDLLVGIGRDGRRALADLRTWFRRPRPAVSIPARSMPSFVSVTTTSSSAPDTTAGDGTSIEGVVAGERLGVPA